MKDTKTLGRKRSDTEAVVEERREARGHKSDGAEYHAQNETGAKKQNRKVATLYVKDPATYIYMYHYMRKRTCVYMYIHSHSCTWSVHLCAQASVRVYPAWCVCVCLCVRLCV